MPGLQYTRTEEIVDLEIGIPAITIYRPENIIIVDFAKRRGFLQGIIASV